MSSYLLGCVTIASERISESLSMARAGELLHIWLVSSRNTRDIRMRQ